MIMTENKNQINNTVKTDYIDAYDGNDMMRYVTEAGFKLYLDPAESLKSMTNVRNTAIIVTDCKIYRVRPEYGVGFCIEVLAYV